MNDSTIRVQLQQFQQCMFPQRLIKRLLPPTETTGKYSNRNNQLKHGISGLLPADPAALNHFNVALMGCHRTWMLKSLS